MKFKTSEATMLYEALQEESKKFVKKFNEEINIDSDSLTLVERVTLIGIRFQFEMEQLRQNLKICLEFDAEVFEREDIDIQLEVYKGSKEDLN